ncbi:MAG: Mut7-C RNAse domain-containing protein [Candidatus Omnitrophota bacterium]
MKLIVSQELGRLARWLRILGLDAAYFSRDNSGSLIIQALREERIILTRNHRLPRSAGIRLVQIESEKIKPQLAEVLKKLQLKPDPGLMFSRCILCNEKLAKTDKETIKMRVPEYVFKTQDEFFLCPKCKRVYWQGTHWGNVSSALKELMA